MTADELQTIVLDRLERMTGKELIAMLDELGIETVPIDGEEVGAMDEQEQRRADAQRAEAIRNRVTYATDGDTRATNHPGTWYVSPWPGDDRHDVYADHGDERVLVARADDANDARFIAQSRDDIPWLLDQRAALTAERDRLAARCAAMESVLRRRMINPCEVCTGRETRASARCARCGREQKFANWEFDEARFAEGGGGA